MSCVGPSALGTARGRGMGPPLRGENTDPGFGKCISHGQFLNPRPPPPMLFNICMTDHSSPAAPIYRLECSPLHFLYAPAHPAPRILPSGSSRDVPRQSNHVLTVVPRALFTLRWPLQDITPQACPSRLAGASPGDGGEMQLLGGSEILLF